MNAMNSITRTNIRSIAVQRARGTQLTTAEKNNVTDFVKQLDDAVRDIAAAVKESQRINASAAHLKSELSNRSAWGSLTSSFSGKTDKELATMLQGLGLSLHATQKIVQLVLTIMTQKNRLLHDFHEALVNKIALMTADSRTLDRNQNAALAFVEQLRDQVATHLHDSVRVDDIDLAVQDIEVWRDEKEKQDAVVAAGIEGLEQGVNDAVLRIGRSEAVASALAEQAEFIQKVQSDDAARIDQMSTHALAATAQIDALGLRAYAMEARSALLAEQLKVLEAKLDVVTEKGEADTRRIGVLEDQQASAQDAITQLQRGAEAFQDQSRLQALRLDALEAARQASRMPLARVMAQLPAAAAGVLGAAALYLSLMP